MTGRTRDCGQAAQPTPGKAGVGIGVDQAPMRRRPVCALVDLLAHRRVKAVVALRKTGDPQGVLKPGKLRRVGARDVQFGCLAPTDAPRNSRIVNAAENSMRIVPRKDMVNPRDPVAVGAETAHLRQAPRAANPRIVSKSCPGPIASGVVAGEYLDFAA